MNLKSSIFLAVILVGAGCHLFGDESDDEERAELEEVAHNEGGESKEGEEEAGTEVEENDEADEQVMGGQLDRPCADGEVFDYGECLSAEAPTVTAGRRHSCAKRVDGTVECWGWSRHGVTNTPEATFRSIDAGEFNSCGITDNGSLVCWGSNAWNISQSPAGQFQEVTVGKYHACALDADDRVVCWGQASSIGDPPDGRFRRLSAGHDHTCGIGVDDTVACWGSNLYGQLEDVPEGRFQALDAGGYETCAIGDDDAVHCWSNPQRAHRERRAEQIRRKNEEEGTGRARCGGAIPPMLPVSESPPEAELREVALGRGHGCGLTTEGRVLCWGANFTDVPSERLRTIDAGIAHYCGVTIDDEILCWGNDGNDRTAVPELW